MKKLLALLAVICLMGSYALAEEEADPWIRYNWTDELAEEAAGKEFHKENFRAEDRGLSLYLPAYLQDAGVPEGQDGTIVFFADEAKGRTVTVSVKALPEGKDLAAKLQAMEDALRKDGWGGFALVLVNEVSGVKLEREEKKETAVMFPLSENEVLFLNILPADDEEFKKDYEMVIASLEAVE